MFGIGNCGRMQTKIEPHLAYARRKKAESLPGASSGKPTRATQIPGCRRNFSPRLVRRWKPILVDHLIYVFRCAEMAA